METNNFKRKCPECNCEIIYSNKYNMMNAEKKQSKCKSCGIKISNTDEVKKKKSERMKGKNNPMYGKYGEQNPFFGKHHTDETKKKMIENKDYSSYKTEEFRQKISKNSSGKNNPMYGKSVYEVWVNKYGEDVANEKMIEYKQKQSKNSSGKNNPMYGKPSPNGSGNGWSGWYKNWFFRSLIELSYMINIIEKYNLSWESAENKKIVIEYINYSNNPRTYHPDFLINNKYLVEIKPKKLWESKSVVLKSEAAIKYCNENNLIYKLRDIPKIEYTEFKNLIDKGYIILTEKYKKKYEEYVLKMSN
jgi:hypothetical protein